MAADCRQIYGDITPFEGYDAGLNYDYVSLPAITDNRECCAACYNTPGCGTFSTFATGSCTLLRVSEGNGDIAGGKSNVCPNGVYWFVGEMYPNLMELAEGRVLRIWGHSDMCVGQALHGVTVAWWTTLYVLVVPRSLVQRACLMIVSGLLLSWFEG